MMSILRTIVKRPLNLVGLDLVRYNPRYAMGEYAYVASLGIRTVIDVGAHMGEFARMIKDVLPGAAIFSFEPLREEFQRLQQLAQNGSGITAFNYAVGDKNETVEIHRSSYAQSSSLLPMAELHKEAFPVSASHTSERVEVKRLDDVLREFRLEPEMLVKIDVQGYEDRVIAGATETLARAKAVIVEVSFRELYEGQPLFDVIFGMLSERGFRYMGNLYQLLSPLDGAPLQADALFVRG